MNLQEQEINAIASLKDSLGFTMLLDNIQAEIDTIQHEILDTTTKVDTEKVLFWRALSTIQRVLKVTPELFSQEMQKIRLQEKSAEVLDQLETLPKEYMEVLLKQYHEQNKKLNKL